MTKLLRRFMLCSHGVTSIEYALIASCIAVVIATTVTTVGTNLTASFTHIAAAFP
jgi:pilus assembly protein Flp/PilA